YEFHRQATGEGPSDADTMAWGYVEEIVSERLRSGFVDVAVETFINTIEFPDAASFLNYWRSTSLFLRSKNTDQESAVQLLSRHEGNLRVTKRVSIASASRPR